MGCGLENPPDAEVCDCGHHFISNVSEGAVIGPRIKYATNALTTRAALESIRGQLHNLEETIGRVVQLQKSLPEGPGSDQLWEEISALDSIADVMRQALDSCSC